MQINDICSVFEYNVETFRYYLVSRIWTILITQDNNQFLRCGLLYIFYSSLYIEKRFCYIYFIQRGAIVLLLSDGQSRALDTVVDDSPHAFFFSNNFLLGDRERKIYILMEKVLSLLAATALLTSCASVKSPLTGFLYNGTKAPVAVTENPLGTKKGEATAISVLGWVAVGDASVQTAARSAGITKISHVDEESTGILGLFAKYKVVVYGE